MTNKRPESQCCQLRWEGRMSTVRFLLPNTPISVLHSLRRNWLCGPRQGTSSEMPWCGGDLQPWWGLLAGRPTYAKSPPLTANQFYQCGCSGWEALCLRRISWSRYWSSYKYSRDLLALTSTSIMLLDGQCLLSRVVRHWQKSGFQGPVACSSSLGSLGLHLYELVNILWVQVYSTSSTWQPFSS